METLNGQAYKNKIPMGNVYVAESYSSKLEGVLKVGGTNNTTFRLAQFNTGRVDQDKMNILWKSQRIPFYFEALITVYS